MTAHPARPAGSAGPARRLARALGCAAALLGAACGGTKGTLTITLVTPVTPDPFAGAAKVHVQVAGSQVIAEQTVTVSGGHFSADLSFKPTSGLTGAVRIEVLDAGGSVIARGRSVELAFSAADASVSVLVARVGEISIFNGPLPRARTRLAAAPLPALGALLCGGHALASPGDGGAPEGDVTDTNVLSGYSMALVTGAPLPQPRSGAVAIAVPASGAVGNVLLAGGGHNPDLLFYAATGSAGSWTTVLTDPILARDDAASTLLADGTTLLTGGTASGGAALSTAAIVSASGSIRASATRGPMASARGPGHSVTAARVSGGDGAVVLGGGAAPEYFLTSSGSFYRPDHYGEAITSSAGHSASLLASGALLVLGGLDGTARPPAATQAAWLLDPAAGTTTVPAAPLLSSARAFHSATLIDASTLLVCGGIDAAGKAVPSCDLIDVSAAPRLARTISLLGGARSGHTAVVLPTGPLLLAGGSDDSGPLSSLVVYQP